MPTTDSIDNAATAALGVLVKLAVLAAVIVVFVLTFMVAAAVAVVGGLMILGAAIALRFAPKPKQRRQGPETLDARATATGWVVETRSR